MGDAKRGLPLLALRMQDAPPTTYDELDPDTKESILKRAFAKMDYKNICGSLMEICLALTGSGSCGEYAPIWDFVCKHFGLGVLGRSQPNSYSKLRQFCDELKDMYEKRDNSLMQRTEPEWILQFNARDLDGMKDSLSGYIERNYALILEASIGLGVDCNVVLPREQYRWGQTNVLDGYGEEPMRPVAYTIWKNPDDTRIFDYLLTLPQIDLGNERIVENRRWDWFEERWETSETEPELRVPCLSPFVVACGYMGWNNTVRLNYVSKLLDDGRAPIFGFRQQLPDGLPDMLPLAIAAKVGDEEVVRFILDRIDDRGILNAICKRDIWGREAWDCSILHVAARGVWRGCVAKLKLLLADSRIDKNLRNDWGMTPLMYSLAWCGWGGDEMEYRLELVAALLEHPDVKDSINATRIHPVATPAPQGDDDYPPRPQRKTTARPPREMSHGEGTALDIFRQRKSEMGRSVRVDGKHDSVKEHRDWMDNFAPRMEKLLRRYGARTARMLQRGSEVD